MPDIDRTVDIKVTVAPQRVTAAIPLVGRASEHWLTLFHDLASQRMRPPSPEAEQREDRTWVLVRLPTTSTDLDAGAELDAVTALISDVNGMEEQFQSGAAPTVAAVRGWWARQRTAKPPVGATRPVPKVPQRGQPGPGPGTVPVPPYQGPGRGTGPQAPPAPRTR